MGKRDTISTRNSKDLCRTVSYLHALFGRGRKRSEWVKYVHIYMWNEFERFTDARIKITSKTTHGAPMHCISMQNSTYDANSTDPQSGKLIRHHIDFDFVRRFCLWYDLKKRKNVER